MKAEQLRKSILQLAIQGKLVPQDPADESASVLLERIRAEKQRLIKEGKIKKDKGDSVIFKGDDNCYYEKCGSEVKNITEEIPFEIPDSWCWCRVRDCYDIRNGFTPLRSESKFWNNGTVPWFTVEDIRNQGKEIYSTQQHITEEAITADRLVPANSFLLCCTASVGIYAQTKIPLTTNQQFNALTVKISHKALLMDEYIFAIGEYFSSLLHSAAGKTTFEFVSVKKLGAFLIPVPPKKEQQRIIDAFQKFEPLIAEYDKLEQQATKLDGEIYDKLKKSILQYAIQGKLIPQDSNDEPAAVLLERIRAEKKAQLGKKYVESYIYKGDDNCYYEKVGSETKNITDEIPFDIPDSWKWTRLNSIVSTLTDGTHRTPKYTTDGIPFLSVKDISSGKISFANTKFISIEEHNELKKRCNPQTGDILLTKVGTTGIPVIVDNDRDFSLFVSVALIKFNHNYINPAYFIYLLKSPLVQDQAAENTRGVGNKNWVLSDIENTLLVIPPLAEQKRIVEQINVIFSKLKDEI